MGDGCGERKRKREGEINAIQQDSKSRNSRNIVSIIFLENAVLGLKMGIMRLLLQLGYYVAINTVWNVSRNHFFVMDELFKSSRLRKNLLTLVSQLFFVQIKYLILKPEKS